MEEGMKKWEGKVAVVTGGEYQNRGKILEIF